jgi:hypothetical protein
VKRISQAGKSMLANDEIRDTSDELGTTLHAQSGGSAIAAEVFMNDAG